MRAFCELRRTKSGDAFALDGDAFALDGDAFALDGDADAAGGIFWVFVLRTFRTFRWALSLAMSQTDLLFVDSSVRVLVVAVFVDVVQHLGQRG